MDRNKKLFSNSLVFMVGNLGSKLISFIMVPLYTYYLSTKQFGTVDLLLTTINLCLPIVSLSLFDAVFRFAMEKNENKAAVLSTGFFSSVILLLISLLFLPLLSFLKIPHVFIFMLILSTNVIFSMFQNFTRAIGFSKVFALSGIVNTIAFASLNIFLLVWLHAGVQGYLLSYLIGIVISIFFLIFRMKLWRYINFNKYSKFLAKRMLKYSIPLIPNSLAWWLTNDSSKFFILAFVGISGNGFFAVANKIPTIINMFFGVFVQAWQISAVDEFTSEDNSEYYSTIFNKLQEFLFLLTGILILFIKPLVQFLFSSAYSDSWKYVPLLLLAVTFANLSSFLGTVYLAAKKTVGVFTTTVFGMLVNVVLSGILTPLVGINGTETGMTCGFLLVIVLRILGVKRFVTIKVSWYRLILSILATLLMFGGVYGKNQLLFKIFLWGGMIGLLIINREFLFDVKTFLKYLIKICCGLRKGK